MRFERRRLDRGEFGLVVDQPAGQVSAVHVQLEVIDLFALFEQRLKKRAHILGKQHDMRRLEQRLFAQLHPRRQSLFDRLFGRLYARVVARGVFILFEIDDRNSSETVPSVVLFAVDDDKAPLALERAVRAVALHRRISSVPSAQ